ncbi:type VI secretion system protein TssA [Rhizobacter sp. OV335]|uniref:type VI secretion system protein TssA n=1 Tax=Rhizobacter sp. OV335 TaxID=1500264 RepID=UPI00091118A0|nr:type VI secretion system protein TssA [Rhizobacter sp. OV335]SHM37846.1 type VI secretion system protein ImpA [Rhizobacter sp. OV335]
MNALPVEELLAPLSDDAPCGPDLEYDPAFLALEEASRGKPEQQFGDTVIPAEDPDWRTVFEQSRQLAERTRDLRVAVLLARSGARQHGVTAYAGALALIAGLLERHWDHAYPLLDADDNNDPTMRLNALAPLVDPSFGLADLRHAPVGGGRSQLTVRQIELAAGKAQPGSSETVPTAEGVQQALKAAEAQTPGTLAALKQTGDEMARIEAVLIDKVGGSQGPELRPLRVLAQCLASAAAQALASDAEAAAAEASDGADAGGAATGGSAVAVGALRSREDVSRTLDRVCEWIERNEPSNPAPLLIRRAQRLMGKNFMDIIRDLASDGLGQVERIAGSPDQ